MFNRSILKTSITLLSNLGRALNSRKTVVFNQGKWDRFQEHTTFGEEDSESERVLSLHPNRANFASGAWPASSIVFTSHWQACVLTHCNTDRSTERERKQPTFLPLRSGTICDQPHKHWHYFKGNLGETAERWGGACMGLSECYDAILSRNYVYHLEITIPNTNT